MEPICAWSAIAPWAPWLVVLVAALHFVQGPGGSDTRVKRHDPVTKNVLGTSLTLLRPQMRSQRKKDLYSINFNACPVEAFIFLSS